MAIDLTPYKQLIRERCGLCFEQHAESTLRTALARRQQACGLEPGRYYSRLAGDEEEFLQLVSLLTVNETYFYREPNHLSLLTDHLLPRMLERAGGRPLRILSAGCSTGEEPYSVAIALRERFGRGAASLFRILGGDIDAPALERARQACYGEFSFRALDEGLRARHFDPVAPGRWRPKAEVREAVHFFRYNLLADSVPAELAEPVDVILFRNVSIYFDRPGREAIMGGLVQRLAPYGHLIVGNTESFANDFGLLPLCRHSGSFFFSRDPAQLPAAAGPLPAPRPRVPEPEPPAVPATPVERPAPRPAPDVSLEQGRQLLAAKRYREALAAARALLEAHRDPIAARVLAAHAHLQLQDEANAEQMAAAALERDPWQLDALLLLGDLARRRGDGARAAELFKQAIYHRPDCWPAHYLLAETWRRLGRPEHARRHYQILQRRLGATPADSGLDYFRLGASPAELARVVEHHLAGLSAAPELARGA